MNLVEEYRRQMAWREWSRAIDALPPIDGARLLDLGCGAGDVAGLLTARGARVVGYDGNEELLAAAREKRLAGAEFHRADLAALPPRITPADGIWSSFAPAYFCDLAPVLSSWATHLRPGGFIALVDVDDLFAHEPLAPRTKALLDAYVADALAAGRYDFRMGRKLASHLQSAGLTVEKSLLLDDREFSFQGPALPDVVTAWAARLDRMKLLHQLAGPDFPSLRDDFLTCLSLPDHRSLSTVHLCLARRY